MSLIRTEQLSCYFGGIKAVNNVDFNLEAGEIRALIGPNGAGKSTFVSMLCGRREPTAGKVYFDHQDITNVPAHVRAGMGIAYTFQITSIFGNLSCYDNVELAAQQTLLRTSGVKPTGQTLASATLSALDQVGLTDYHHVIARNMSYGHQRLLEVAMGLALKPRLLMLDEPTQGLADTEIDNFVKLIKQVAENATVLLIEHNMRVVMQLAQRITVLDAGEVLAEGTPSEIQANAAVQHAYLGG